MIYRGFQGGSQLGPPWYRETPDSRATIHLIAVVFQVWGRKTPTYLPLFDFQGPFHGTKHVRIPRRIIFNSKLNSISFMFYLSLLGVCMFIRTSVVRSQLILLGANDVLLCLFSCFLFLIPWCFFNVFYSWSVGVFLCFYSWSFGVFLCFLFLIHWCFFMVLFLILWCFFMFYIPVPLVFFFIPDPLVLF